MPLPMPVSLAATREEFLQKLNLRSLNITTTETGIRPVQMTERIREAMQALSAGGPFGYADIAKKMPIAESTLKKDPRYMAAVVSAGDSLGLRFVRGGDGRTGCFTKAHGPREPISDSSIVPKDIISGTALESDLNPINPLPSKASYLDAVCDQVRQGLQAFFSSKFKMAPATTPKAIRPEFGVDDALTA